MTKSQPITSEKWVSTIKKLSAVQRFSQIILAKPENVLEHTGMVSLICLNIAERLNAEGYDINLAFVLRSAILHDIEESETGDISKPSKYFSDTLRDEFRQLEESVAYEIFKNSDSHANFQYWLDSKDKSPSGKIVSFVDTLCAVIKFHDEIYIRGNKSMLPALSPLAFENLYRKLDDLLELYPNAGVLKDYERLCIKIKSDIDGESHE